MLAIRMPMPRRLHFGAHQVDVLKTLDQWYGPDYRYIKVRGTDGSLYILRFDEPQAKWELTMFKSARAQVRGWRIASNIAKLPTLLSRG